MQHGCLESTSARGPHPQHPTPLALQLTDAGLGGGGGVGADIGLLGLWKKAQGLPRQDGGGGRGRSL